MKREVFCLSVVVVTIVVSARIVRAATINVPADYLTIQAAIDAAANGDEVVVAPGTYNEIIDFNGKAITLRSTDPANPAVVAATVIDATGVPDPGDGLPVVRCDSGEGVDTVLGGFTLTGGTGDATMFAVDRVGGGMYNVGSIPTVMHCIFIGNMASYGGGMYNFSSSPTVIACAFSGNEASLGGGMANFESSRPVVTNCTFSGNMVIGGDGGGMYNNGSDPTVSNCTFSGNKAGYGGGMRNIFASPTVTNCTFGENTATYGGGQYISYNSAIFTNCTFVGNSVYAKGGGIFSYNANLTVANCAFSENTADIGGGIYNISSRPSVTDCTFSGNSAVSDGGAMYNHNTSPTVTNCIFSGNMADTGGGMRNQKSLSPTLINCTFSGNLGATNGGGIYNYKASPMVTNSIFWGNADSGGMDESAQIHNDDTIGANTPAVNYSDIQGGWTGLGSNNINADPLFVTGPGGDFYLSQIASGQGADSPCVDTGSGHHALFFLAGTTRTDEVADIGTVDMGYHYGARVGSPDLDSDGDVDGTDFLTFSNCFNGALNPPAAICASPLADLDGDGDVDPFDFLSFSNCFNGALNPPACP